MCLSKWPMLRDQNYIDDMEFPLTISRPYVHLLGEKNGSFFQERRSMVTKTNGIFCSDGTIQVRKDISRARRQVSWFFRRQQRIFVKR